MKKSIPAFLTSCKSYLLLPIFYFLGLIPLARAGPVEGIEQLLTGFGQVIILIIQFLSNLILDLETFDEFFIAKLMLFVIIFIVIYTTLRKSAIFGGGATGKNLSLLVSASMSILSIKFIPNNDFVNGILLPYGALGAAITTMLPFLVIFIFINKNIRGSIFRRSAWILYGLFFVGIWWMRRGVIDDTIMWIYTVAFILIILSIIFDKQIQKTRGLREVNKFLTGANSRRIVTLQSRYLTIENNNSPQAIAERKKIEQELSDLGAYIVS